ncbi:hypothetical protein M758_10G169900 [Ceratodon purpureus]|nr:hypothetical protein M758_10G169900 [Ceratodon purpureus]
MQVDSQSGKPITNFIASSNMSGMSSRTSPLGSNKTVAFSKPTSTVIHGESSLVPRMGLGFALPPPGQHQSTLRAGPRLRAEGLMVPPASDAATLRRQVAALQIDLEAHIDGEQRLQSINQQLRERLELYMKQNHENVERAESELNTLHEDMEQTLELQRRLAQRATALEKEKKEVENDLQRKVQEFENERITLQSRIKEIGEDLREKAEAQERVNQLQTELLSTLEVKAKLEDQLAAFEEETAFLKKKADDYSNELRDLILKEQLEQKLDRMGRRAVTRRAFINFEKGVREQCINRANAVHAVRHFRQHGCRKIFYYLRMASYRSCLIRRAFEKLSKASFQQCWRIWRLSTIARRRGAFSLRKQAAARVKNGMHSWIAYIIHLRLNPAQYVKAVDHWHRKCLEKCFGYWSWLVIQWRLPPKEEKHLTNKALRHYNKMVLHSYFLSWQDWLKAYAQPKRKKFATVQAHINKMTLKQAVAAWRCIIHVKWVRRMKYDEAEGVSKNSCKRRSFSRWQEAIRELKIIRLRSTQAMQYRNYRQAHLVFKCWRNFLQHLTHMRIYKQIAFRHYLHSLSVSSMKTWRENVNYGKAQQRATAEVNQALTRAAMVFWRDYHVYKSIKKKQDYRAGIYRKRKQTKLVKMILRSWWEHMAWKRKAIQLDILLTVRRRRSLQVQTLHAWMHATFDGLLLANAKFHEDLLEAQAQFEEQREQVTTVDVENLQLIDRLHTMSSEIAYLKTTVTDKEKQEEDLHRALEDNAVLESSMQGEIEQQHVRAEELELEIQSLQKRLQMKNAEDTAGEIHHTLEIQNLEQAVKELRMQLSDKSSQIACYEKALKETAQRLEGASDESQEKLTSAFEIAGSLRKLLEDRENQFANLEGNCRRREMELGEVQRKLAAANCTLCETVECRDARIQELEAMLCCRQQEVQETQQQLQDLELAMDLKESRVRKLEYELKLMSEQTALKTKTFVSSLSSWSATPQFNPDVNASLRGVHSLKVKESLRHTYFQAKSTLQQQSAGTSFLPPPFANNSEDQQADMPPRTDGPGPLAGMIDRFEPTPYQDDSTTHLDIKPPDSDVGGPLPATAPHRAESMSAPQLGSSSQVEERAHMDMATSAAESLDQESRSVLLYQGQDMSQPDWETSFALVSTTRPTPPGYMAEPGYAPPDVREQSEQALEGGGGGMVQTTGEGPYRMILDDDPSAVDSLHIEIQRLQARIMSRLRDSAAPPDDSSNRSAASRATPRPPPETGPSSGRSWDSR